MERIDTCNDNLHIVVIYDVRILIVLSQFIFVLLRKISFILHSIF